MALRQIQLRGVRVHNLRSVDLDVPHRCLIAFCGISGSGKTSLALDTLFAEGQRRYIESFSAYTRQFLQRMEKPDADHIDGIPPAIAVTHKDHARTNRATIGGITEIDDYLRLLFAKIGQVTCDACGQPVRRQAPGQAAERLMQLPEGTRCMLVAPGEPVAEEPSLSRALLRLREDGFARAILNGELISLADADGLGDQPYECLDPVIDRISVGSTGLERITDSLETVYRVGRGRGYALSSEPFPENSAGQSVSVAGSRWYQEWFSSSLRCERCDREFPGLEPRLFSYNSPLGACPICEGFGNVVDIDLELVVPDRTKSLREGAIAPWSTPAYAHELEKLLALAEDYGLPTEAPFEELSDRDLKLIREGVPERKFGGLEGFFDCLEKRKYKMHVRVFLSRWRTYRTCPACQGARLKPDALAVRVGGRTIAEFTRAAIDDSSAFLESLKLSPAERAIGHTMLEQILDRLRYLVRSGLGYLSLDRTLRTLSGGEAQRVRLTSALGSSLVNMLYVLDEPSVGLHPCDMTRLVDSLRSLRDRGNTVVVVEHEEAILRAADHIIEIGPGAGDRGGRVVFEGPYAEMVASEESLTGAYVAGRRGLTVPQRRRQPDRGWIRLAGARGNNLQNLTVEFPLGVLCLVTGVSGAGKSTLVQDTLYSAVCRRKRKDAPKPYPYEDVFGDGQIDDVVLIDQSPIGRSPRSNPVTYVKAFDEIRSVFAETIEARTHNYTAGHFSFNVDGGRCPGCKGDGFVEIDMQFLADVYMKCDQCDGTRYRKEILDVSYRGRSIADVLDMTVRQAFTFFRGQGKVQEKLKRLIDVGLDYLRLGQPANTLSSGEAQRLKLAAYISSARRHRTLFIMDEPTTGLHQSDIVQLIDCFDALLAVGHSLIVVEHNLQLMKAADYMIDLGPGAAAQGGTVVIQGTPEKVAHCRKSITGRFLADALGDQLREQTA